MKKIWSIVLGFVLCFGLVACASSKPAQEVQPEIEVVSDYEATIEVENYGTIKCRLLGEKAPETVKNFVKLCDEKFYDGNALHRIIADFVIQGGMDAQENHDTITGEFEANGIVNTISHKRGTISMARAMDYNGASTQFFICQRDCSSSLDGQYAAFGYVTEGLDVVDAIVSQVAPKATDNNGTIEEKDRPIITSIRCTEIKE
ncbi:MAG: peptidylprolyl isomerase [Bacillota bacterium]|nr:peptidylprolyl isomerase [Bacillota bacterium]